MFKEQLMQWVILALFIALIRAMIPNHRYKSMIEHTLYMIFILTIALSLSEWTSYVSIDVTEPLQHVSANDHIHDKYQQLGEALLVQSSLAQIESDTRAFLLEQLPLHILHIEMTLQENTRSLNMLITVDGEVTDQQVYEMSLQTYLMERYHMLTVDVSFQLQGSG